MTYPPRRVRRVCAWLVVAAAFAGARVPAAAHGVPAARPAGAGEPAAIGAPAEAGTPAVFARSNLMAWCIVPFDARKRTPAQRAEMLQRLGIRRYAYDWRDEHLPTFEDELAQLKGRGIELTAVWFPGGMNGQARFLLDALARHKVRTQLWVTGQIEPGGDQAEGVKAGADMIRPIAAEAAKAGCTVALYNHGGWFGEPENLAAVVGKLKAEGVTNVGIAYNLHHGHDHLARLPAALKLMKPHLLALNLNGMTAGGDARGMKILPVGQGDLDLEILKTVRDSGYAGPVGILNHTDEDAEARLKDNLDGLDWLLPQLSGKPAGPKPVPATWREPAARVQPGSAAAGT